jgi:hypothetical protein
MGFIQWDDRYSAKMQQIDAQPKRLVFPVN